MGSWDGLTNFEIESEFPGALAGLQRHDWFFHSPDGENYESFATRLNDALQELRKSSKDCIVVAHGVSGRVLRGLHGGLTKDEALKLDASQDAIFKFAEAGISQHRCAEPNLEADRG